MQRRVFIGDIQGCRFELEDLLAALRFDPASDRLFPVGDLVNRGPDSLGALRLLRRLEAQPVLGNHDVHLLRVAQGTKRLRAGDTLNELLAAPDRDELLAWLADQPLLRTFDDLWLVHAALHPDWAEPEQVLCGLDPLASDPRVEFATRARYCDPRGERPERDDVPPPAPFAPWHEIYFARYPRARRVVYGHWAQAGLTRTAHSLGLDSGCVWGGRLSAWIAEENRLVQVPARRAWAAFD